MKNPSKNKLFLCLLSAILSAFLSVDVYAVAPYTAIVSINGAQVIATDANGTVIQTGVAGTDDAAVINYALSRRDDAVVYLAPATTFTCNQTITVGHTGGWGVGCQHLIGGGANSTIVNYTGSADNVILVDATSYFVKGAVVSNMTINANGHTGLFVHAIAPAAAAECAFEKLHINNVSTGIKIEGFAANEVYKCAFRDIAIDAVGSNGYGIHANGGCYNTFDNIQIVQVADGAYAISTQQWGCPFSNISTDGCISESGQSDTWIKITIETIFASTPPGFAFRLAGHSHCVTGLELISIDPARCPYGLVTYGNNHIINGFRAIGSCHPTYAFFNSAPASSAGACVGIGIKGATNYWAIDPTYWKFIGCEFKTENSGSSTGTGSSQTIAHGLIAAPNNVNVVPSVTGATVSGVWADAANIYVKVTSGKAYKWSAVISGN